MARKKRGSVKEDTSKVTSVSDTRLTTSVQKNPSKKFLKDGSKIAHDRLEILQTGDLANDRSEILQIGYGSDGDQMVSQYLSLGEYLREAADYASTFSGEKPDSKSNESLNDEKSQIDKPDDTADKSNKKPGILFVNAKGEEEFMGYDKLYEKATKFAHGIIQGQAKERGSSIPPEDQASTPSVSTLTASTRPRYVILHFSNLQQHLVAFWGCILSNVVPVTVAVPPIHTREHVNVRKLQNVWDLLTSVVTEDSTAEDSIANFCAVRIITDEDVEALTRVLDLGILNRSDGKSTARNLAVHKFSDIEERGEVLSVHSKKILKLPASPTLDSVAFLQLTSGSTGIPKAVQISHVGVAAHAWGSAEFLEFNMKQHPIQTNDSNSGKSNSGIQEFWKSLTRKKKLSKPGKLGKPRFNPEREIFYSSEDITLNWLGLDHVVPLLTCHCSDVIRKAKKSIMVVPDHVLGDALNWLRLCDKHKVNRTWAPNFGYVMVAEAMAEVRQMSQILVARACSKSKKNSKENVTPTLLENLEEGMSVSGKCSEEGMSPSKGWGSGIDVDQYVTRDENRVEMSGKVAPSAEDHDRKTHDIVPSTTVKKPSFPFDLSSVESWINAGEQVTMRTIERFTEATGVNPDRVVPSFGMAEACTCFTWAGKFGNKWSRQGFGNAELENQFGRRGLSRTSNDLQKVNTDESLAGRNQNLCPLELETERGDGPTLINLGPPFRKLIDIRIVDSNNVVLKQGTVGRIQIRGITVTPGYLGNDKANQEAFVEDRGDDRSDLNVNNRWFTTGDCGVIVGNQFAIAGRESETVVIRGVNLYCHELEECIRRGCKAVSSADYQNQLGDDPGHDLDTSKRKGTAKLSEDDSASILYTLDPTCIAAISRPNPESGTEELGIVFCVTQSVASTTVVTTTNNTDNNELATNNDAIVDGEIVVTTKFDGTLARTGAGESAADEIAVENVGIVTDDSSNNIDSGSQPGEGVTETNVVDIGNNVDNIDIGDVDVQKASDVVTVIGNSGIDQNNDEIVIGNGEGLTEDSSNKSLPYLQESSYLHCVVNIGRQLRQILATRMGLACTPILLSKEQTVCQTLGDDPGASVTKSMDKSADNGTITSDAIDGTVNGIVSDTGTELFLKTSSGKIQRILMKKRWIAGYYDVAQLESLEDLVDGGVMIRNYTQKKDIKLLPDHPATVLTLSAGSVGGGVGGAQISKARANHDRAIDDEANDAIDGFSVNRKLGDDGENLSEKSTLKQVLVIGKADSPFSEKLAASFVYPYRGFYMDLISVLNRNLKVKYGPNGDRIPGGVSASEIREDQRSGLNPAIHGVSVGVTDGVSNGVDVELTRGVELNLLKMDRIVLVLSENWLHFLTSWIEVVLSIAHELGEVVRRRKNSTKKSSRNSMRSITTIQDENRTHEMKIPTLVVVISEGVPKERITAHAIYRNLATNLAGSANLAGSVIGLSKRALSSRKTAYDDETSSRQHHHFDHDDVHDGENDQGHHDQGDQEFHDKRDEHADALIKRFDDPLAEQLQEEASWKTTYLSGVIKSLGREHGFPVILIRSSIGKAFVHTKKPVMELARACALGSAPSGELKMLRMNLNAPIYEQFQKAYELKVQPLGNFIGASSVQQSGQLAVQSPVDHLFATFKFIGQFSGRVIVVFGVGGVAYMLLLDWVDRWRRMSEMNAMMEKNGKGDRNAKSQINGKKNEVNRLILISRSKPKQMGGLLKQLNNKSRGSTKIVYEQVEDYTDMENLKSIVARGIKKSFSAKDPVKEASSTKSKDFPADTGLSSSTNDAKTTINAKKNDGDVGLSSGDNKESLPEEAYLAMVDSVYFFAGELGELLPSQTLSIGELAKPSVVNAARGVCNLFSSLKENSQKNLDKNSSQNNKKYAAHGVSGRSHDIENNQDNFSLHPSFRLVLCSSLAGVSGASKALKYAGTSCALEHLAQYFGQINGCRTACLVLSAIADVGIAKKNKIFAAVAPSIGMELMSPQKAVRRINIALQSLDLDISQRDVQQSSFGRIAHHQNSLYLQNTSYLIGLDKTHKNTRELMGETVKTRAQPTMRLSKRKREPGRDGRNQESSEVDADDSKNHSNNTSDAPGNSTAGSSNTSNMIRSLLHSTISSACNLDNLDDDVSFFDQGIHSLQVIRIARQLSLSFGLDVTIQMVFEHSSVNELCQHLTSHTRFGGESLTQEGNPKEEAIRQDIRDKIHEAQNKLAIYMYFKSISPTEEAVSSPSLVNQIIDSARISVLEAVRLTEEELGLGCIKDQKLLILAGDILVEFLKNKKGNDVDKELHRKLSDKALCFYKSASVKANGVVTIVLENKVRLLNHSEWESDSMKELGRVAPRGLNESWQQLQTFLRKMPTRYRATAGEDDFKSINYLPDCRPENFSENVKLSVEDNYVPPDEDFPPDDNNGTSSSSSMVQKAGMPLIEKDESLHDFVSGILTKKDANFRGHCLSGFNSSHLEKMIFAPNSFLTLRELNIGGCGLTCEQLENIPMSTFQSFKNLTVMSAGNNRFKTVPRVFEGDVLTSLRVLDLSCQRSLMVVNRTIEWSNLEDLQLVCCRIAKEGTFRFSNSLKRLRVSETALSFFDVTCLNGCEQLVFLDLSGTRLGYSTAVSGFCSYSRNDNPAYSSNMFSRYLSRRGTELPSLPSLRTLLLRSSEISEYFLSREFRFVPNWTSNLRSLYLQGNRLSTLPCFERYGYDNDLLPYTASQRKSKAFPFLRQLEIQQNSLTRLPESLESINSLRVLYAHGNQLDSSALHVVRSCPLLQYLGLGGNRILQCGNNEKGGAIGSDFDENGRAIIRSNLDHKPLENHSQNNHDHNIIEGGTRSNKLKSLEEIGTNLVKDLSKNGEMQLGIAWNLEHPDLLPKKLDAFCSTTDHLLDSWITDRITDFLNADLLSFKKNATSKLPASLAEKESFEVHHDKESLEVYDKDTIQSNKDHDHDHTIQKINDTITRSLLNMGSIRTQRKLCVIILSPQGPPVANATALRESFRMAMPEVDFLFVCDPSNSFYLRDPQGGWDGIRYFENLIRSETHYKREAKDKKVRNNDRRGNGKMGKEKKGTYDDHEEQLDQNGNIDTTIPRENIKDDNMGNAAVNTTIDDGNATTLTDRDDNVGDDDVDVDLDDEEYGERKYKRILIIGSSMGASAALLFANLADRVVAFSPETDLDLSHGQHYPEYIKKKFKQRIMQSCSISNRDSNENLCPPGDSLFDSLSYYSNESGRPAAGGDSIQGCPGDSVQILNQSMERTPGVKPVVSTPGTTAPSKTTPKTSISIPKQHHPKHTSISIHVGQHSYLDMMHLEKLRESVVETHLENLGLSLERHTTLFNEVNEREREMLEREMTDREMLEREMLDKEIREILDQEILGEEKMDREMDVEGDIISGQIDGELQQVVLDRDTMKSGTITEPVAEKPDADNNWEDGKEDGKETKVGNEGVTPDGDNQREEDDNEDEVADKPDSTEKEESEDEEARLEEARLAEARRAEKRLEKARLAEARLAETKLAEARFAEARLTEARFTEARLAEARLAEVRFSKRVQIIGHEFKRHNVLLFLDKRGLMVPLLTREILALL